jgi:gas vesicle protein
MSILSTLAGGAMGFLTGGPVGAVVGGITGSLGGQTSTSLTGTGVNGLIQGIDTASELDQAANYAEQARHNSQMQWESTWFNEMLDQRSETMRESNDLRSLAMEQRKADNEVTKEFIKSIRE